MANQINEKDGGLSSPTGGQGAIFLIGFMGSGKSHWGRVLGEKLSLPFFDLDEVIEEQAGQPIPEIFAQKGEEHFRLLEKEVLYMLTESHDSFVMATGGGTPCFFNNIDYLKKNGIVVWFNSSMECLYQRLVKEKHTRPLISEISDDQLESFIAKKFASRKIFYQQAHVIINEDEISADKLLSLIFPE